MHSWPPPKPADRTTALDTSARLANRAVWLASAAARPTPAQRARTRGDSFRGGDELRARARDGWGGRAIRAQWIL